VIKRRRSIEFSALGQFDIIKQVRNADKLALYKQRPYNALGVQTGIYSKPKTTGVFLLRKEVNQLLATSKLKITSKTFGFHQTKFKQD
jgi:hypothetical protein